MAVLTFLGFFLTALLTGVAAPAGAATPAPSTSTTSTANTAPRLGWSQDTVYVQSDATSR